MRTRAFNPWIGLLCAAAWVLLCGGCDGATDDDDTTADEGTPPDIVHDPVPDGQPAQVEVDVTATVTDADGLSAVTLYYRVAGTDAWSFSYLYETETPGDYLGKISASVVTADGVDYYLRAVDSGVPRAEATSPEGAPESFHHFDVDVLGEGLPFSEDWEGGTLGALGWSVVVDGFGDYEWERTDTESLSGDYCVMHKEGINDIAALKDWLISPPLEFDGTTDVAASWWELVLYGGDAQVHQIYVSMGSPDPEDGDFELVADLPVYGADAWASSDLVDLTPFVSEGVGYVAFYYEGEYPADRWHVDDVYIGEPVARFELVDVTVDPEGFGPGGSADLTVTVRNVSLVDSLELTGTLGSDDAELSFPSPTADYGVIASGDTASGAAPFTVEVAVEHPDNAYLDLTLTLDDGEHSWDLPFTVLMGQESSAIVDYDAADSGEVLLAVGHGDTASPAWEDTAEVGDTGQWTTDITGEAAVLPPDAGEHRWWLKVDNAGLYPATIDGFSIEWGGVVYSSSQAPVEVLAQESTVIYLPPLPVIEATAVSTYPDPVSPGDQAVQLIVEVTNTGDVATAGALVGDLTSADPDVSGITGGGIAFGSDPLDPGMSASNVDLFTFDVAAGHTDDSPLELTLELDDGVDRFDVPVAVEVPWAHVEVEQLVVDDSAGNGDGVLDAGETVLLTAALRNTGDYDTAGPVSVTIAQATSSQAQMTIADDAEDLGVVIAAGDPVIAPAAFELTVDSGYMGDAAVLDVTITDGQDTWEQTVEFEITERPWTLVSGSSDAAFDANGYMFDIDALYYKTDGTVLWIKTTSHTPFDESLLWLTYAFYDVPNWWRLEFYNTDVRLYDDWFDGWFAGDRVYPVEPIIYESEMGGGEYAFIWRVLLDDLEIDGQSLRMGLFAGSCPYIYYCDTSPDGWFELDLANAQYSQDESLLYVFAW